MPNPVQLVVTASPEEVMAALRHELSDSEISQLRIELFTRTDNAVRARPIGEQATLQVIITFLASSAASGLAWDIMKKVIAAIQRNLDDTDKKD